MSIKYLNKGTITERLAVIIIAMERGGYTLGTVTHPDMPNKQGYALIHQSEDTIMLQRTDVATLEVLGVIELEAVAHV